MAGTATRAQNGSTPSTPARGRLGAPRLLVPVLALAGITVALQQTIVVPLVPQFPRLLGASAADTTWIVTATLLAGAVATPVVGRLADMIGKRRMLLVCLAVLITGSVIGALSTSLVPLVVGRTLQGLAAGVIPLGISLMRDHLPAERLGSSTALMSASLGVGGALGLPLAALVAQVSDWHMLFWAAGGLGVLVLVLVLALVPESPERDGGRFDLVGAAGLSVTLVALLLAVSKGGSWGWTSPLTVGLLVMTVVTVVAWALWELRTPAPLVDLRVSRGRQVLLTNTASAVFGFSMFAMSLVFPQLLQLPESSGYGLGQSVLVAGLVLAPGGLCMMLMSPVSARITATSGPRTTLMLGAVVVAAGYVVGALLHGAVWQLFLASIVISSGIGLAYGAMPSLIMAAVPVSQTAAANSLNNLMRALGTSVASAVAGVLLAELTITVGAATMPAESAFVAVMVIGAVAAVAAIGIVAFIPARRPGTTATDTESGVAEIAEQDRHPTPPVLHGVVTSGGVPAGGAVLTVIGTGGEQVARGATRTDGTFALARQTAGRPNLLVIRAGGPPRAIAVSHLGPGVDVELGDLVPPLTSVTARPHGAEPRRQPGTPASRSTAADERGPGR